MTLYIKIQAEINGAHANQSTIISDPPYGYIEVPAELEENARQYLPWATLTIENDILTGITFDEDSKTAWELANQLSNTELREQAYETDPVISWDSNTMTVDAANQLWAAYSAEGNTDKATQLQALIVAAKTTIRETYPN